LFGSICGTGYPYVRILGILCMLILVPNGWRLGGTVVTPCGLSRCGATRVHRCSCYRNAVRVGSYFRPVLVRPYLTGDLSKGIISTTLSPTDTTSTPFDIISTTPHVDINDTVEQTAKLLTPFMNCRCYVLTGRPEYS